MNKIFFRKELSKPVIASARPVIAAHLPFIASAFPVIASAFPVIASAAKQSLIIIIILLSATSIQAQNIQLHYDLGRFLYPDDLHGRPLFTSTVEMFKPDRFGSTFFFTDFDYKSTGVASAYWEISRELKFWKAPVSLHFEYNGGTPYVRNAYLSGATYSYNSRAFGWSLSAMYKYIQKQDFGEPHNFQITGVWRLNFGNDVFTFTGFADLWREKNIHGTHIFLAEPQIWIHLNRIQGYPDDFNLSIGSETEISYNFAARKGAYFIPTAAIRYDF